MNARDLDLAVGGGAIALAGLLARAPEPAVAITVLAISLAALVIWLGEERIEALWRAYCHEPAPRRVKRAEPQPIGRYVPPARAPRVRPELPRARVVTTRG